MVMRGGCDKSADLEFCNCMCHESEHVEHIMACCAGKCLGCGRFIKIWFADIHYAKCLRYKSNTKI